MYAFKSTEAFSIAFFLLVVMQAPCRNLRVRVGHLMIRLTGLRVTSVTSVRRQGKSCSLSTFPGELSKASGKYSNSHLQLRLQ